MCATQLVCGTGTVEGETKPVVQKDAEFDVTYNDTVTSKNQTIYAFNHTISRNKVGPPASSRTFGSVEVDLDSCVCSSDGGGPRVRGRAAAAGGEPHPVRDPAEAGCHVLSSPAHPERPVSETCQNQNLQVTLDGCVFFYCRASSSAQSQSKS